jgi:hypothetical protein
MKHEVFDRWLTEELSADYVMEHLKEANFEPEFYKTFEQEILNSYTNQFKTA